jgi:electron transfer flavoprotein beta subunit
MAAKSKPVETVTTADLGVAVTSYAQQITSVEDAPAREAGEVIEDDGESFNKIVEFLDNLKVI